MEGLASPRVPIARPPPPNKYPDTGYALLFQLSMPGNNNPHRNGIKEPFYHAQGFCGSRIWAGQSGDDLKPQLGRHEWLGAGVMWRLLYPQHLGGDNLKTGFNHVGSICTWLGLLEHGSWDLSGSVLRRNIPREPGSSFRSVLS